MSAVTTHRKDFGRARAYGTPTVLGRCSRSRMRTLCGEEKGRNSAPTLDRGHASYVGVILKLTVVNTSHVHSSVHFTLRGVAVPVGWDRQLDEVK